MEEAKFKELLNLIQNEINNIPLSGVRGKRSFRFLRSFTERREFKFVMKNEMSTEKSIDALKDHIKEHYVVKAENDLYKAVHSIILDYDLLRRSLFNFFLLEYNEIKDMQKDIELDIKYFGKHSLSEEQMKNVTRVIIDFLDGWMDDLKKVRELINSSWDQAKGGAGWAGRVFKALHKEGYFIRFQERRHFKRAIKDAVLIENDLKKLAEVKNQKELEKLLNVIKDKSPEMKEDVRVLDEMLFTTWNHLNDQLFELVKIISEAAAIHELPSKDSEQMRALHEVIVMRLEEKLLHSLRIDEAQMEETLADLKTRTGYLRKEAA